MKTREEILARLSAIAEECKTADSARLDELEAEARGLNEQLAAIADAAEKRAKLLADIAGGAGNKADGIGAELRGIALPEAEPVNTIDTKEYRTAFLLNAMGKAITEQQRALITSVDGSAGAAIPTLTYNKIIEKVLCYAPLLSRIQLLNVSGNVTFAVEVDRTLAEKHAEGAEITAQGIQLVNVTLSSYEVTKLLQISRTVEYNTIDSFESWLVNMLARSIGDKINALILYGTGSGEATGIETAVTWVDDTNQVTVAASATASAADVLNLIGMLGEQYDPNAIFVMSKRTLMTVFMPLQDKSKHSLVTVEGGKYFIEGYPVETSANVPLGDAYLGDFGMYVGNMPQSATIESAVDLKTNTRQYLGAAQFDGKVADTNAFVKLTKATS